MSRINVMSWNHLAGDDSLPLIDPFPNPKIKIPKSLIDGAKSDLREVLLELFEINETERVPLPQLEEAMGQRGHRSVAVWWAVAQLAQEKQLQVRSSAGHWVLVPHRGKYSM